MLRQAYSSDIGAPEGGPLVLTAKGMYAYKFTDEKTFPYTFVSDDGTKTELKLTANDASDIFISLLFMPNLPRANTVQPEIKEFVNAPKDTPGSVRSFMESLVPCGTNEYSSVELGNRVGVGQLEIFGGCGNGGAAYYIFKNCKFEKVLESMEGFSCEERDNAGLSSKLVGCSKPGEGH